MQEKFEECASVFATHGNSEQEKNKIIVEQEVNQSVPKFARHEITTYLPSHQKHSTGSRSMQRHRFPKKCPPQHAPKNDVEQSLHSQRKTAELDNFVIVHLSGVMKDIGLGGLLLQSPGLSVKGLTQKLQTSDITSMPTFREIKELIQTSLMDPVHGLKRVHTSHADTELKNSSHTSGSMVMDLVVNHSSSDDDEDCIVDISEEEIVQFIRTEVNVGLDDADSSEASSANSMAYIDDFGNEEIVLVDVDEEVNEEVTAPNNNEMGLTTRYQDYIHPYRKRQIYRDSDRANIELYHLLSKCHAPVYLFDDIQNWSFRNASVLSHSVPLTRTHFLDNMENKVHGKYSESMKPRVDPIRLTSGRTTAITTFSFEMGLISKLTDPELMKPENLLIDIDDPFKFPDFSECYAEVNTGSWHRNAFINLCHDRQKDFLLPLAIFVDAVNGDNNGHHSLEPVVVVPLIFKRVIRNQARSWFTIGYIESLKTKHAFDDEDEPGYLKDITPKDKIQDYHDMMAHILKDLVRIQQNGGIEMTLKIGEKSIHCTAKVPVQFIIGDCKGDDILCGRYGSHGERVRHLVRDCDILTLESDDPDHVCRFFTSTEVQGWSHAQCKNFSFHKIHNAFWNVDFGGDPYGIYGSTPPEPLHVFQMGLCVYLVEEFLREIYTSTQKLLDNVVANIVSTQSRQSHRGFPSLSTFRNGFINLGTITGKEKYARIFVLYLALMTKDLAKSVSDARGRGPEYPPLGADCAKKWLHLIEATLGIGQWFKKVSHPKDTIDTVTLEAGEESPAQVAARRYLKLFKAVVNRQIGNGLRIVKYHHILHFCWYIERYGCIPNFDGSRPEGIAKINTKDKFRLTQKQSSTENYQTACRLYESETVEIAYNEMKSRGTKLLNAESIVAPRNDVDDDNSTIIVETIDTGQNQIATGSKFIISLNFEDAFGVNDDEAQYKLELKWAKSKASLTIDEALIERVARRLYLNKGPGGCLMPNTTVIGFTEYKTNGFTYRCHPSYRSGKPWNDWAMIKPLAGNADPLPGKIYMLLDLRHSDLMTADQHKRFCNDKDPTLSEDEWSDSLSYQSGDDEESSASNSSSSEAFLSNGLWCIVRKTTRHQEVDNEVEASPYHFESRISERFRLLDDLHLLPIEYIKKPCFVMNASMRQTNEDVFLVHDKKLWCERTFMDT